MIVKGLGRSHRHRRYLLGVAVAVLVATAGCGSTPLVGTSERGNTVVVETQDGSGRPLRATSVWWYLPSPSNARTDATCVDTSCTTWTWPDPPVGAFRVAAKWTDQKAGALCYRVAYATESVFREASQGRRITLRLVDMGTVCE